MLIYSLSQLRAYTIKITKNDYAWTGEAGGLRAFFFCSLPEADAIKQAMVVQRQAVCSPAVSPLVSCGFDLPPGPAGLLVDGSTGLIQTEPAARREGLLSFS